MNKNASAFSEKWSEMHYLVLAGTIKSPVTPAGPLWREICTVTRRDVAIGQVYAAIDRLERFGCLTTEIKQPAPNELHPVGRKAKYLSITPLGHEVLRRSPLAQMLQEARVF